VTYLPILLLIPLWFLLVRPQQRRLRAQQEMVRSLQVGDDVITSAGIYGTIVDLDDETASLEVADGVEIRIARMAVGRRLSTDEEGQAPLDPPVDEVDLHPGATNGSTRLNDPDADRAPTRDDR